MYIYIYLLDQFISFDIHSILAPFWSDPYVCHFEAWSWVSLRILWQGLPQSGNGVYFFGWVAVPIQNLYDRSIQWCVCFFACIFWYCMYLYILRLVLWTVLHMDVDSFGHFAPDCSSWGIPSRGTSLRNFINAAGNVCNSWVKGANLQVSRNLSSYIRDIAW